MLERARQLSDDQGLTNVTFVQADAQVHRFPPTRFDLCISRFGTMFFADPVAAFTNIGRALRPAARLVLLVWQERGRNEWATAIRQTLTGSSAAPRGPDPFSLADPTVTEGILAAAGFAEVSFTDVHEPVYYGPDSAAAFDAVLPPAEIQRPACRPRRGGGRAGAHAVTRHPRRPRHRRRRVLRLPRLARLAARWRMQPRARRRRRPCRRRRCR